MPGGPPWAAALFGNIALALANNTAACNACTAATAANTAAVAALQAATVANTAAVAILLNRTSAARATALKHNSKAFNLDHTLIPVPHSDTGALPPPVGFPGSIRDLRQMTAGQVNALLQFYGLPVTGVQLIERRKQLAEALGCDG